MASWRLERARVYLVRTIDLVSDEARTASEEVCLPHTAQRLRESKMYVSTALKSVARATRRVSDVMGALPLTMSAGDRTLTLDALKRDGGGLYVARDAIYQAHEDSAEARAAWSRAAAKEVRLEPQIAKTINLAVSHLETGLCAIHDAISALHRVRVETSSTE